MDPKLKVMTALTIVALLNGCGSGGDFGETTVSSESLPHRETSYSPCGTYNGHPVECRPLRPDFSFEDYGTTNISVPIE